MRAEIGEDLRGGGGRGRDAGVDPVDIAEPRRPGDAQPRDAVGEADAIIRRLGVPGEIVALIRPAFLTLASTGAAGRKSATAAAMSSTSQRSKASWSAACSSAAVCTSTRWTASGTGSATFAATSVTSAPRATTAAARATPMRPDERLPT